MRFALYDVVRLRRAVPEKSLEAGSEGTIVLIYDEVKPAAYEVEFCDEDGFTLALLTADEDSLEAVQPANSKKVGEK